MNSNAPAAAETKNWHVVYTRSRAEKKVAVDLAARDIECYLPLQRRLRQYSNRRKWVDVVLISGYCFVNISRKDYDRVLQTGNVVSYVAFNHQAAIIPQQEIDHLKQMLIQSEAEVEVSHESFTPGKKVMIMEGPMLGLTGELMEEHGRSKFLVRIDAINTAFITDISARCLSILPSGN
jgi:transcription antitermination factor NusG